MDIEVYCQNPQCGVLWGDAELVNPDSPGESVVPYPGFAAYYDNIKNCWFCPSCGYQVPAHIIGSQPQLWLQDMSTPVEDERKRPRKRPAWMGKPTPIWKSGERSDRLYRRILTLFRWPGGPYSRPGRSTFRR